MTPRQDIRPLGRQPALDGVRALAVLGVLGFHAFPTRIRGGYFGVDLFFALSGFLITSLLLTEREVSGKIDFGAFYLRRALRLLPALFAVVVIVFAGTQIAGTTPETETVSRDAPAALLYAANWVFAFSDTFPYGPLSHTWTLSIEEQYYALWPLVLAGLLLGFRRRRGLILAVVLIGVLASMLVRIWLYDSGAPLPRISFGTDTRIAPLLLGCALGMCTTWWAGRATPAVQRAFRGIGALSLAVLIWMAITSRYDRDVIAGNPGHFYEDGLTLAALASAGLILGVTVDRDWPLAKVLSLRPLAWVGRVSYGLYLWQAPVFVLLTPSMLGLPNNVTRVVQLGITFAVAAVSFYLLEQPFLKLKARFERRPERAGSVSPRPPPAGS